VHNCSKDGHEHKTRTRSRPQKKPVGQEMSAVDTCSRARENTHTSERAGASHLNHSPINLTFDFSRSTRHKSLHLLSPCSGYTRTCVHAQNDSVCSCKLCVHFTKHPGHVFAASVDSSSSSSSSSSINFSDSKRLQPLSNDDCPDRRNASIAPAPRLRCVVFSVEGQGRKCSCCRAVS
jgi:hypothetical protein